LVVEDEKRLATSIRRGLEAEGFDVDVAFNGTDGLWLARENAYDAIVLDIMLPGLSGSRICARLREAGDWTPILMVTAKDGERDEAKALDSGADDFLSKPFSFVVLVARLRAHIRQESHKHQSVLQAGDLRLDPAGHRCWRNGEEIYLTPRQFSLLEYFLRRQGDVLSKAEILEHVWDFAYEGDPNIVEVYVRNLRKRIDIPFDRASIETVRGVGYRLRSDAG
jgi:DNA-binding response OmpR family regulator